MKRKPPKPKETNEISADNEPSFPYGLELRLDDESLKKLGMSTLPKVGSTVYVVAEGVVTSVSDHSSTRGMIESRNRHAEIQLQRMATSTKPLTAEEAVEAGIKEASR